MDLLLSLLLIPFAMPLALGFVNMCCCVSGIVCGSCPDNALANVQCTFSGVANASCSGCTNINQTYTLPFLSGGAGGCQYFLIGQTIGTECLFCGANCDGFQITIASSGGTGRVTVISITRTAVTYELNTGPILGSGDTCQQTFTGNLANGPDTSFCDWSAATAVIAMV
jgi:hypothetical protein